MIVYAIIAIIIIFLLRKEYRQEEKSEDIRTQKIIDAIEKLGDKIDGKSITDKPK